jgi:alkylation response protein AidB-like acyl-CoA dehydrogenase
MPIYKPPVEDALFLLNDVLRIERYNNLPGFAEATPDTVAAIFEEGARLFEEVFAPLNLPGDREGCTRSEDGSVATPAGFKEAYRAYVEGGWMGISAPVEYGGQGLPIVLNTVLQEFGSSANLSLNMYPGLTQGAIAALYTHGSEEQKRLYLPRCGGAWTGTMNLTEPHCGTDLGLLKTKAVPNGDGSYAITGTKIFISAGEHDMAENIVHLVAGPHRGRACRHQVDLALRGAEGPW